MKSLKSISLFLTCLAASVSCSKHAGDIEPPPPAATITFSNPLAGASFHNGDMVAFQAIAIARNTIHGYDLSINNKSDTAVLYFKHVHQHNDTLIIDQKWENNIAAPSDLEAKILLYLDHDGHTFSKRLAFKVR